MNTISALILTAFVTTSSYEFYLPFHATAYCDYGYTASGEYVREGLCATGYKSHIGQTVEIYQRLPDGSVGEFIGEWEVKDCGCKDTVIDVWKPDLESCQEFMDLVYEDGCQGKIYVRFKNE